MNGYEVCLEKLRERAKRPVTALQTAMESRRIHKASARRAQERFDADPRWQTHYMLLIAQETSRQSRELVRKLHEAHRPHRVTSVDIEREARMFFRRVLHMSTGWGPVDPGGRLIELLKAVAGRGE